MCGTSAINSLVLPKEKMKDMDKLPLECRDKYFMLLLFPQILILS